MLTNKIISTLYYFILEIFFRGFHDGTITQLNFVPYFIIKKS